MSTASPQTNNLVARPPVVGIFGHIDHGKSTLLDYIRKSNTVEKEVGGITQHIGAYEVSRQRQDGHLSRITFLDTPGHEAFSNIRTCGADVADIAVLVVSGEEGVKPQTLEVYKYIKNCPIPYIVAITKMDRPSADIERTKQSLAESGIYVEGYGGDITAVPLSAKTGEGVDELLDIISLQADLLELKSDKELPGEGVVIESRLDPKRGITATCIIKNGTVRRGMFAASGQSISPVRFMLDGNGKDMEELSFSAPVQIVGWNKLPEVGCEFKTFLKKEDALEYVDDEKAKTEKGQALKSNSQDPTLEDAAALPLIIKADTAGSLQAVESEIGKISLERIVPRMISSGVGSINEKDVKLAIATPGTTILGFHTKTDSSARALAERSGIPVESFSIIYELTDRVAKLLSEREPRIEVEEMAGNAKVLKLFGKTKNKQVVGARVFFGKITINASLRIIRREVEIGKGIVRELQQAKVAAGEVIEGAEFGAMIESKVEIAPGDVLEAMVKVTR